MMISIGAQRSGWALKSQVTHNLTHSDPHEIRSGKTPSAPNPQVFLEQPTFSPAIPEFSLHPELSPVSSDKPSSGVSYKSNFSKRRPRHVPIVLSHNIITSVLSGLPDSPKSQGSEGRSSSTSTSGSEKDKIAAVSSQKARHIPIVIPAFAQPHSLLPPTPSTSESNTPRASPRSPYSCEQIFMNMPRPPTNDSRTSTLDSNVSVPSPEQMYAGQYQPSSSTYLADMNSSQSSLNQMVQDGQQSADLGSRPSRAGEINPYSTASSPAPGQRLQPTSGTTNLSGLVCNVHRSTGKEPHALVGATTTILGDKLYVFGGRVISRRRPQLTSDLYELDLIRRHWTKIEAAGNIPPPRYFHSVCTLGDTKLICYGGMSPASPTSNQAQSDTTQQVNGSEQLPAVSVMSDIHIYDTPTRTWTYIATADTPQGRYAHCAAVLPSSATFTSANAPLSAIHHNPASANPNQGSIGMALDGSGGAEMVVVGGQDSANHYIEQISVFNLRSLKWTATHTLGRSCGAYRSVVAPLTSMPASKIGKGPQPECSTEQTTRTSDPADAGSCMLIYSNYNFLDVRLELQVRLTDGSLVEKPMNGQFSPPGLRFPNGGVLDNHFVVSGTYLTSSKQEYALWALDLTTLTWSRIDAGGSVFSQGSWNRGLLWSRRNTFIILGNRKRSLVEDYNHRRINFSNICMVELEAFGLYDNPRRAWPTSAYPSSSAPILPSSLTPKHLTPGGRPYPRAAIELGQMALNIRELADMDLLALGGERLPVNSHLLARRWGPYFVQLLRDSATSTYSTFESDSGFSFSEAGVLRPSTTASRSVASRNSSITITPSISTTMNSAGTATITSPSSHALISSNIPLDPPTPHNLSPPSRPRVLYLPHTLLTLRALVHYLYTSSLPTPSHPLCSPQILCSLLQLARPYRVDGLLEAVVERLHQVLDGRNTAAVFNAAAMAAGGGRGTGFLFGGDGPEAESQPAANPRRLEARDHGAIESEDEDSRSEVSGSTMSSSATGSDAFFSSSDDVGREGEEVWDGGISSVVGLQKRGLRGLMEGRRMRERGKSGGQGVGLGLGIV